MEYIRIGDDKIKLILSVEETEKYCVCAQSGKEGASLGGPLRKMLEDLREKTGFDARDGKALIEAFPSKRGGCELFITLLQEKKGVHTACYRFPSIAAARRAAASLTLTAEEDIAASLYALEGGEVLLALPGSKKESTRTLTPHSVLEEYGTREKHTHFYAYAKEYGTCLYASNAVTKLAKSETAFSL